MSDIALDSGRDLDVSALSLELVEDEEGSPAAIAQELGIALLFHQGEWKQNVLVGVPWLTQIFPKNTSLGAIAVLLSRGARSVPGIVEVLEMTPTFDNTERHLSVDFKAKAQDGGVIEDRLAVVF